MAGVLAILHRKAHFDARRQDSEDDATEDVHDFRTTHWTDTVLAAYGERTSSHGRPSRRSFFSVSREQQSWCVEMILWNVSPANVS